MGSMLSYNIHGEVEHDAKRGGSRAALIEHLKKIKPNAVLVLRNLDLAIAIGQALPQTRVLIRYWPDDDAHLTQTPFAWIAMVKKDWDKCKAAGVTNVAFCTTNEPGEFEKLVLWHTRRDSNGNDRPTLPKGVMDYASEMGMPLSVLHLAIGAVQPFQAFLFRPVLQMCAKNDSIFTLGIHEYFTALPSSGMPRLDAGGKPYFEIMPDKWPRVPDEMKYHAGRHQMLDDESDKMGIIRARKDLTEVGADRLDEGGGGWVAAWLNSLPVAQGYLNIRSWRSCVLVWAMWFAVLKWSSERTYFEMMMYLVKFVWGSNYKGKSRRIESALMFCWWNSGTIGTAFDWTGFRVDNAKEFQALLEQAVSATTPPINTEPPIVVDQTITIKQSEYDRLKSENATLTAAATKHNAEIEKAKTAIQAAENKLAAAITANGLSEIQIAKLKTDLALAKRQLEAQAASAKEIVGDWITQMKDFQDSL